MDYLEEGLQQRFNNWGMREPLVADHKLAMEAAQRAHRPGYSDAFKAFMYAHTITGAKGLEFVAFSRSKLPRAVRLPNNVILHPCFVDTGGKDIRDPLVGASMRMGGAGKYIYDGWLPIESTEDSEIINRIEDLRESLSSFVLVSGDSFDWEPKYFFTERNAPPSFFIEEDELETLEDVADKLSQIHTQDRHAILRSLAWISRAQLTQDCCSKFLFAVLAIESLCSYIENETEDDSPLKIFSGPRKNKAERRLEREEGIKQTLEELLEQNPTKAIQEAYFTWVVPIKRMLREHLQRVMGNEDDGLQLFFSGNADNGEQALYDIRHLIAHGGMSNINESDLLRVSDNVWSIENFATRYVWRILNKALDVFNRRSQITASIKMDMMNNVLSRRGMYNGPVDMALVYYNRI